MAKPRGIGPITIDVPIDIVLESLTQDALLAYAPLSGEPGPTCRLMMLTDGEKIDLGTLADQCVESWRSLMTMHDLHVPDE